MFLLYGVLAGIIVGWLRRGSLTALASLPLRWWPLAIAGLAIQVMLFALPPGDFAERLGPALHVLSVALVLAVVLANLRLAGMRIVALGGLLNAAVIMANGGTMPASPNALDAAGVLVRSDAFANSGPVRDPVLASFGDVYAIPAGIPLANVFSPGDVILAIGIAALLAAAMGRGTPPPRRCQRAHGPTEEAREYQ